jgi:glutathione S-transferase
VSLELFAHPLSSYCWKVLIALWENATPFDYRHIENGHPDEPANAAALLAHWPLGKFPLLVDDGRAIPESSIIVEHLQRAHPGAVRFLPDDPDAALEVRLLDRIFDNHVMAPMQRGVLAAIRSPGALDPAEMAQVRVSLDAIYAWLDDWFAARIFAAAGQFSLADCAAAPALFYADRVHRIGDFPNLKAYRDRLFARPGVVRAIDEARPFRHLFPLDEPDRD